MLNWQPQNLPLNPLHACSAQQYPHYFGISFWLDRLWKIILRGNFDQKPVCIFLSSMWLGCALFQISSNRYAPSDAFISVYGDEWLWKCCFFLTWSLAFTIWKEWLVFYHLSLEEYRNLEWIPLRMKRYGTLWKAIKRYTSNSAVNCTLLHYYLINLVRNSHV